MCRIWRLTALFGMIATLGAAAEEISPVVKTVKVHAGLPALEVRIVPTSTDQEAGFPHAIGRVELSRRGEPKLFQTITVTGEGGPHGLVASLFEDANFDGYTDLLLGHDGGAKWTGYAIYFYDTASKSFIQTGLSREMSKRLTGNYLQFHRATGEIEVDRLVFGCQEQPVAVTYVIAGDHLRQTGQEDLVRGKEGCYRVTRRILPGGAMREVSRQRAPDQDETE
jgi:hypothetical protein